VFVQVIASGESKRPRLAIKQKGALSGTKDQFQIYFHNILTIKTNSKNQLQFLVVFYFIYIHLTYITHLLYSRTIVYKTKLRGL
jgi:hypothetical protein